MAYKNLNLFQFRNIENTEIKLEEGVNIFYGNNGQGKTNLLEAIYLLSRGKSFRTLDSSRCIAFDKQNENDSVEKAVAILKSDYIDSYNVSNSFKVRLEKNKKSVWLNDKKTYSTRLSTVCSTVLFSPESLSSIKEGPQQRRDLIDDLIEQIPEYSKGVLQFRKILKARNKVLTDLKNLLKNNDKSQFKNETDLRNVLQSINDLFFKHAEDLVELRVHFLTLLKPYAEEAVRYIFNSKDTFDFKYEISGEEINFENLNIVQNLMKKRAQELQLSEVGVGHSLIGPQKHDIQFIFNGKDSRYYCSQGQQRALIVALKVAEIFYRIQKREERPVLLLDDVMSELDEQKRERLVDFLKDIRSQIIITTTEKSSSLEKIMGTHRQFYIKEGRIAQY